MAYCDSCKEARPDGQKFCGTCGRELAAASRVEPTVESPVETPAQSEAESRQQAPPAQAPQQTQYPPQVQEAVGFFNKLGLGMKIAGIGALVSFIFTLIFAIVGVTYRTFGFGRVHVRAGVLGEVWVYMIGAVVVCGLIYLTRISSGKPRTIMTAGVIGLGGMWIPVLFGGAFGWGSPLFTIAMIGGLAQIVGGFLELSSNA